MKKDEVLKFIEEKGDADFVIRTGEEDKTFLENYGKKIEEEPRRTEAQKPTLLDKNWSVKVKTRVVK